MFPFSTKIKLITGVKCEKLYSENRREFIRQAPKIVPGWNGLSEFLAVLKQQKIIGIVCFSEQIVYRKQSLSHAVPLNKNNGKGCMKKRLNRPERLRASVTASLPWSN